jgi:hypothetical protein
LNIRDDDRRTFIPFVSADGKLWMVALIYKSAKDKDEITIYFPVEYLDKRKPPFKVVVTATAKGYVTTDLWRSILDAFLDETNANFQFKECCIKMSSLPRSKQIA